MKLHITQDHTCTEDTFWEMYWADDFEAMLRECSTVDTEVIEESEENDVVKRRLRFTPHTDLPTPAAKLIGSKKLIYEQQNAFYRNKNELTWEGVSPQREHDGGRVKCQTSRTFYNAQKQSTLEN